MSVHGGKEQRVTMMPDKPAEVAFEHTVKKKAKKKFLGHGCNATAKTMIMIRCSIVREALKSSTMFCLLEPIPKRRLGNSLGQ